LTVRDKVLQAAERIAETKPFDAITFAEVAEAAQVHWTAVRRHFGGKREMREWLKEKQEARDPALADTKTRVLESAASVFSAFGYTNASLDKVAEHAGLSKGAVYWHFSSKQDLFLAMLEGHYERQLRMLPGQIERVLQAEEPASALAEWLASQLLCLESGEADSMLFMEFLVSGRDPDIRERMSKLHRSLLSRVAELLLELQRRRYLDDSADPYSIAAMFDALLKGVLVEWILDPRPERLRSLIRTVSRTLGQGIVVKR
jgi:Transcriptional regulator